MAGSHIGCPGNMMKSDQKTCKTGRIKHFLRWQASTAALADGNKTGARWGGLRRDDFGKAPPSALSLRGSSSLFFLSRLLFFGPRRQLFTASTRGLPRLFRLFPYSRKNGGGGLFIKRVCLEGRFVWVYLEVEWVRVRVRVRVRVEGTL